AVTATYPVCSSHNNDADQEVRAPGKIMSSTAEHVEQQDTRDTGHLGSADRVAVTATYPVRSSHNDDADQEVRAPGKIMSRTAEHAEHRDSKDTGHFGSADRVAVTATYPVRSSHNNDADQEVRAP